jgi:hypothetical protein
VSAGQQNRACHRTARATGTHYLIRRQARANRPHEKQSRHILTGWLVNSVSCALFSFFLFFPKE